MRVIKTIALAPGIEADALERVRRKSAAIARLDHPRIPRILECVVEEVPGGPPRVKLEQERPDGPTLEDAVRQKKILSRTEILKIGLDLSKALTYLHSLTPPIVHGDVKPANVVLSGDGAVWLMGPALESGGAAAAERDWEFAPFEAAAGRTIKASDFYSLGATLLFAATGRTPSELGYKAAKPLLRRKLPTLDPELADLIEPMIEPDWRRRPAAAPDLVKGFSDALSGSPRARKPRPALVLACALGAAVAAWFAWTRVIAPWMALVAQITQPQSSQPQWHPPSPTVPSIPTVHVVLPVQTHWTQPNPIPPNVPQVQLPQPSHYYRPPLQQTQPIRPYVPPRQPVQYTPPAVPSGGLTAPPSSTGQQ